MELVVAGAVVELAVVEPAAVEAVAVEAVEVVPAEVVALVAEVVVDTESAVIVWLPEAALVVLCERDVVDWVAWVVWVL